jgi:hypothetical protein
LHPIGKIIIGAILVIGSIYYILNGFPPYLKPAWRDLIVVLKGAAPPLVFLLGIFIIWLELDELRIERELEKEEKKAKKKK